MVATSASERAVLDFLLHRPAATVQQVADHFELSASTAANVTARLMDKRLIVRGPNLAQGRGRPQVTFRAALPGLVAAVAFDGSHVDAALFDDHAEHVAEHSSDLVRVDSPAEAADIVDEVASRLLSLAHAARGRLALVVVSLNAVRRSDGSVLTSSVLPWLTDDLPDALRRRLDAPVVVLSTGLMAAELRHVDSPDVKTIVRFNVGDGVSSHAMVHGRVAAGRNNLAGEIGHVTLDPAGPLCGCGKRGCVEAMVSGPAIRAAVLRVIRDNQPQPTSLDLRTLGGRSVRTAVDHIYRCWLDNDYLARYAMTGILDSLAWTLSVALNLIDPDLVRVDGYVLRDRQAWIDELVARVRPQLLRGEERQITIESARATRLDQLRIAAYLGAIEAEQCKVQNAE